MKNFIYILLFCCLLCVAYACGSSELREVVVDGRYKMMIPENMKPTNALNDGASLQYQKYPTKCTKKKKTL